METTTKLLDELVYKADEYELNFIVNLQARNGYCKKVWQKINYELKQKKVNYNSYYTRYSGHATEIVKKIARKSQNKKIIIAVGGDGTIHEVINGAIKHKNIVIANIPTGSGNDFSRGFNIPRKPIEALSLVIEGEKTEKQTIDIGTISNNDKRHFFANNAGAGFDALITSEANKSKMKKFFNFLSLGTLVYVYILLKRLFTYKTTSMEIVIDGKRHRYSDVWFVTVSNQPYYGGGMKIAPWASATDGQLDITIVAKIPRLKILFLFLSVFWGGHTNFKGVKCFRGYSVNVSSSETVRVHADGEHIGTTPIKIGTLQSKMTILRQKN